MKRTAGALVVLAVLGGCASSGDGSRTTWGNRAAGGPGCAGNYGMGKAPMSVPGMIGPGGQPVAMVPPYTSRPLTGTEAARAMLAQNVPLDAVQRASYSTPAGAVSGIMPANLACPPGGCPPGMPGMPGAAGMLGGGGMPGAYPPGAVAAAGALTGGMPSPFPSQRTEVRFVEPAGMKVYWYVPSPQGKPTVSQVPLDVPGRYNFMQAAIYRLKLTDIPNQPGLELYPTLEVVPANARTATFLAHSAVPVSFTNEDFQQVASGNFVVKVVYLPDPQFQDLAAIGPGEIVSSRLEPGVDPIAEAHKRGSILLVVRLGNIDLEAPNTPAMDAPSPYQPKVMPPPPHAMSGQMMAPGMPGPGPMMPYGMMGPNGPMMGPNGPMMPPNAAMPGAMPLPPGVKPPMPNGPVPTAQPGVPVGRLPDASAVQQTQYKNAAPTPAELAGQRK